MPERSVWTQIKEQSSIAEYLLGRGIPVKFRSRTHIARCPFPEHEDSTPSLAIYDDDTYYYCFGCASTPETKPFSKGDIIDMRSRLENLPKVQILQQLARDLGIDLHGEFEAANRHLEESERRVVESNEFAISLSNSSYWQDQLRNRRNLDFKTIAFFNLGVSGDDLVIPLRDEWGRLVGFTRHNPRIGAKYVNPPTSEVYHKDEFLYNADSLRFAMQKDNTIYISEGYFDVMSLHEHGYKASVGICGSRLTNGHINLLKKYINPDTKIILIPDNDKAGWGSLEWNFELLRSNFKNSYYVVSFPQEQEEWRPKDACDWFTKFNELPEKVPYYQSVVEYHIAAAPDDQEAQARRISKALINASSLEKAGVIKKLSLTWAVDETVVAKFIDVDPRKFGDTPYKDSVYRINEYIDYIKTLDNVRLSTGFKELDEALRGINPGEVLGVMGRANVGKTLLITEMYKNLVATSKDTPTVFFSLEMQSVQLQERLILQSLNLKEQEGVPPGRTLEKLVKEGDPGIIAFLEELKKAHRNLIVVDTPGLTAEDMNRLINEIETTKFLKPVARVVVDHLMIMKSDGKTQYERVGRAVKDFRNMIRTRGKHTAGILLIQTSRSGGSGGEPLSLENARDSGEIEETLDSMIAIWRPELKYKAEIEKLKTTLVLPVRKLKKDSDGKVVKGIDKQRIYESEKEAYDRARHDMFSSVRMASETMKDQKGLVYIGILKSRREGRGRTFVYRQEGLNFTFLKESGGFDDLIGDMSEVVDPLDDKIILDEGVILKDADLPAKALLGQPREGNDS